MVEVYIHSDLNRRKGVPLQIQRLIRAADLEFNTHQSGDHPEIVFLHGFGSDLHAWDGVWDIIAPKMGALRYDLRGFGQTVCERNEPFCHADDLLAILDALQIDTVTVCGVSMGGAVALHFALEHPDRIDKLVLISPALVAWEWSEKWKALWRPIVDLARAGKIDEARERWWQHPLFASTRNSRGAQPLRDMIMRFSGAQWIRDYERPSLPEVEHLYTLRVPTLLMTGELDMEDFRLIADVIEGSTDRVTRIDMPVLGHSLQMEDPELCAHHLLKFVQRD